MKKLFSTVMFMTAMGFFIVSANNLQSGVVSSDIVCDGGHECSDKCKKDKDGKCAEAGTADNKGKEGEKPACCSKESKESCHGKKSDSKGKSKGKDSNEPKS